MNKENDFVDEGVDPFEINLVEKSYEERKKTRKIGNTKEELTPILPTWRVHKI